MCLLVPADTCPPGVELFSCLTDPCATASCPSFRDATCTSTYCGGCFAHFFFGGNNVTNDCEPRTTCPDGSSMVQCLTDPCVGKSCPEFTDARCVSNYCGGCNHIFENADGRDVTGQCTRCKLLVTLWGFSCSITCQAKHSNTQSNL